MFTLIITAPAGGENWPGFRGPDGSGISTDKNPPVKWSDSENLKWKITLPGPGSSSPIVWGDRVFVTCYSGYGLDRRNPGNMKDLKRHLICIDRNSGKILWNKAVASTAGEDPYRGYISEHGYASHTPVTDGKSVFVFFGKTGAIAFDFTGKQLWKKSLGTMSGTKGWGSAASPILHENMVIINAADEGRRVVALDKKTGRQLWKAQANSLNLAYNTPLIVTVNSKRKDLVIVVPKELRGLNPNTGKLRWYAKIKPSGNISPSVVADGSVVFATGGYMVKGTLAVQTGGKGNVTTSHMRWTTTDSSYVPSPIVKKGHLYWVNESGVVYCLNAKTGKRIYRKKLTRPGGNTIPTKSVYASITESAGKFYIVTRKYGTFIVACDQKFRQLAVNQFKSDTSDFNASPAISNGQIFIRSNRSIYCIQNKGAPTALTRIKLSGGRAEQTSPNPGHNNRR